jgi:hypothetical protein
LIEFGCSLKIVLADKKKSFRQRQKMPNFCLKKVQCSVLVETKSFGNLPPYQAEAMDRLKLVGTWF